jgi:GT2 family glycosyltransferase/glycosyltransferase involved in cell wall biosynthesis
MRVVTHYDSYFDDPLAEAGRILSALDLPPGGVENAASATIPDLRHNRFTTRDLIEAHVPSNIVELYLRLCREAGRVELDITDDELRVAHDGDQALNIAAVELKLLRRAYSKHQAKLADRNSVIDGLAVEVREARDEAERAGAELRERHETVQDLRSQLEAIAERVGRDAGAAERDEERTRDLERQLIELEVHAKRIAEEMERRDASIRQLQGEVERIAAQSTVVSEELQRREASVADIESELAARDTALVDVQHQLEKRTAMIADLERELKEIAALHAEQMTEEVEGRKAAVRALQAQLEQVVVDARGHSEEIQRGEATIRELQNELSERAGMLVALERRIERGQKQVEELVETVDALRDDGARTRADRERLEVQNQALVARLEEETRRRENELSERAGMLVALERRIERGQKQVEELVETVDALRDDGASTRADRERLEVQNQALVARLEDETRQRESAVGDLRDQLRRRDAELHALRMEASRSEPRLERVVAALQSGLAAALSALREDLAVGAVIPAEAPPARAGYPALRHEIQEIAQRRLERDSPVAVVSRGDDELVRMVGLRAVHFPQADDGRYAGYHPADSGAAINHLEGLRESGIEFVLFPATAFWWLKHYEGLRNYLEQRYELAWQDAACQIYDLRRVGPPRPPVAPGGNGVDVVCFPIIDWNFRFQRPQQLLTRLARAGHRVFYVATRLQQDSDQAIVEPIAENVYSIRLPGPAHVNLYADALGDDLTATLLGALDSLRRDARITQAISVVHLPFWTPLALGARERWDWHIVYDCLDDHGGFSTTKQEMLKHEEELEREADLVVATSQRLHDRSLGRAQRLLLLPNAADFDHFAVDSGIRPLGAVKGPVIGYYGAISDWFDTELIRQAALKRPEWTFVLIGDTFGADVEPLRALRNVRLLGEKPYEALPGYLHQFDVACIPFRLTPLTEATNPLKFYEYMCAGKPVVAVDLPELAAHRDYYYSARDAADFVRKVEQALAENSPDAVEARVGLARRNTWEHRYEKLSDSLRPFYPKAAVVVLSFDNLEYLRLCLSSLWRETLYPNFEVIVVDNASSQPVIDYLVEAAEKEPRLRLILNEENLGFARANNLGLEAAGDADYLFLLNDDTVVTRGWLGKLIRHLQDERVGLVGPVSNWAGNEARIDVPYDGLDGMAEFAERYMREHAGCEFDIPMLAMYCVGIRRQVLEKVGYLNEHFAVGMFEDDDFAIRVRKAWYRVICAEDVFIHHWGRASFKKLDKDVYETLFEQNRQTFENIWGQQWQPHRGR